MIRAREPVHGRTSYIEHSGTGLFRAIPSPIRVARYHSLIIDEGTLPKELIVTARTDDMIPMACQTPFASAVRCTVSSGICAHAAWPYFARKFRPHRPNSDSRMQFLGLAGTKPGCEQSTATCFAVVIFLNDHSVCDTITQVEMSAKRTLLAHSIRRGCHEFHFDLTFRDHRISITHHGCSSGQQLVAGQSCVGPGLKCPVGFQFDPLPIESAVP